LAGAVAGSLLGIVLQWLGLTDRTFHDLAQVFILSRVHPGTLGFLVGILAHFGVAGLFGAIFAHFIVTTNRKYIIVKGLFVGATMWLLFVGLGNYFRLPVFSNMPPSSALAIWLCSAAYGLVMSWTANKLTR
jgi:hypothetical protein